MYLDSRAVLSRRVTSLPAIMSWNILLLSLALTTSVIEGVTFTELSKAVNVNESTPLGTYITTVKANPNVGQPPGSITYSLQGTYKDYFQINSSGVITTAAILDSEAFPTNLLQLTVFANKPQENQDSMIVIITVHDLNDNIPQFIDSPYQVNVSEATKINEVVAIVTVIDRDKHPNNEIELKIVSGDAEGVFSIDGISTPQRGLIKLEKSLDFEGPNGIYHLNVTATDLYGTGNINWTTVTITVINEDDNGPTFPQYLYKVLIDANTPKGFEFVKVHAEDKDFDPVSYSIHPASDPAKMFTINNLTGSISVDKNLTQVIYHLIVTAESRSSLPNPEIFPPAFALVIVHVGNMPNRTFESSVMENEANTLALDLKPVEQYFNVSNPVFSILLGDAGNKFVINQTTKELRVGALGLDREQSAQYNLVVELRSNGINRGFARIDVNVLDTNDNRPQFLSPASVSVREDTSPGTVIFTVMASDRDAEKNGAVVYEIVAGNGQGFFALNNQSGVLSLSRPLDYETAVQYVLNISASDSGEPQLQSFTYVTLHVTDVNDNSPVLYPRTVRVSLVEGCPPGSYVTQCNATDADSAVNAEITYLIMEGAANKFSIDNVTGVITTTGQFDRESGVSEYVLVVKAQDKGRYPRADVGFVTVSITNMNEHSPVISPSSLLGAVYKETTYYSLVTTIKATDEDFDSNSVISYDIVSGDGADYFHVEPHTGHVRVACSLAEKKDPKYTLEVSASDGGKTSANNAMVDIFLLNDEDSVILTAGVTPQEITRKRLEFVGMFEDITGGKAFIKHLVPEDGKNSTLVTFHAVKDKNVMTGSEIISFFSANEEALETTYKEWNIQGYQSPATLAPEAQKGNSDEQLSAVGGAMICLGVIIGLAAIIMIIILIRRKQTGKSPFKKKRKPRVTFNDNPFFIDPDHGAMATNQVERAQEAQEVIVHIPAEDDSSLEGSETSSQPDVFINFGIAATREAMKEKDLDEISADLNTFFPPPPTGPPPPPPDSDSESDENNENVIADASEIYREEYTMGEENPNVYRQDDEGEVVGIVLSQSPPGSTTGSMTQLVNEGPRSRVLGGGSFLRKFSLNDCRTDL